MTAEARAITASTFLNLKQITIKQLVIGRRK